MKYIMVMEDGQIYSAEEFTEDDKKSVDAGVLDVIDVGTGRQYFSGEWHDLQVWGG